MGLRAVRSGRVCALVRWLSGVTHSNEFQGDSPYKIGVVGCARGGGGGGLVFYRYFSCSHPSARGYLLSGAGRGSMPAMDNNSSSSGSGGRPFSSFTRSPNRLAVRDLSGAQETAFEPLRLHLKPVSEGEEELQPTSSDN